MTDREDDHRRLLESVRTTRRRRHRGPLESDRSVLANLGMIGSLGTLAVVPTLCGVFVGRWLDGGEGVFWTMTLTLVGVMLGAWLAWQRVMKP